MFSEMTYNVGRTNQSRGVGEEGTMILLSFLDLLTSLPKMSFSPWFCKLNVTLWPHQSHGHTELYRGSDLYLTHLYLYSMSSYWALTSRPELCEQRWTDPVWFSTIHILVKETQMLRFIKITVELWGRLSVRGYARARRAHNPGSGKTSRHRRHLLTMLQPRWSSCTYRFLPTPGNFHLLFPQHHVLFPLVLTVYSHTSSSLGTNITLSERLLLGKPPKSKWWFLCFSFQLLYSFLL